MDDTIGGRRHRSRWWVTLKGHRYERGHAVGIEAAIILPALVLFVALVIVLARDALAQQAIGGAASQAARAASLERTPRSARASAQSVAASGVSDGDIPCLEQHVTVDAAGLRSPLGTPSTVSVTVSCLLAHDITLPGFPQQKWVSETRTSPVDTYRGR